MLNSEPRLKKNVFQTLYHSATICLIYVDALEGNVDDEGVLEAFRKSSTVSDSSWAGDDKNVYLYVYAFGLSHQTYTNVAWCLCKHSQGILVLSYSGSMCRPFAGSLSLFLQHFQHFPPNSAPLHSVGLFRPFHPPWILLFDHPGKSLVYLLLSVLFALSFYNIDMDLHQEVGTCTHHPPCHRHLLVSFN